MTNFKAVREEAINRVGNLVDKWLKGKRNGKEFIAINPTRSDSRLGSFCINLETGVWNDFADSTIDPKLKADPVGLYAYLNGMTWVEAANELAKEFGLIDKPEKSYVSNITAPPPPETHFKLGRPSLHWKYNDTFYIYRFETKDGKEFRPLSFEENKWKWKNPEGQLPLYKLKQIEANLLKPILICEGEKAADAAEKILEDWITTTTAGGSNRPHKSDFTPLKGRIILIWPDNDEAGQKYAQEVYKLALSAEAKRVAIIKVPEGKAKKWDAAEALAEGTTELDIMRWVNEGKVIKDSKEETEKTSKKGWNSLIDYSEEGKPSLKKQSTAARILAEQAEEINLAFDEIAEKWMIWEEAYWQECSNTTTLATIDTEVEKRTLGIGYSIGYINGISAFLKWRLKVKAWNKEKHILPMKNGALDLNTMKLVPHTKELKLNWQLPYNYNPSATCEPIIKWLHEAVEHGEQVELLQAYLNCILLGRVELQKYLELIGSGGSGKGTFIRLAETLIGSKNTLSTELKRLEGDNSRFETARIYGKRLIVITDAERFTGDVSMLKAIVGGDPLPYEEKNKQGNRPNFRSQAMVLIAANEPIQSTDYTYGIQRRRITMNFNNTVLPSKRRDLEKEFTPFLPGLLNWVLSINPTRVTNLILEPIKYMPTMEKASIDNLLNTNPIAAWLDERIIYSPDTETSIGTDYKNVDGSHKNSDFWLYPSYCEYCELNKVKPVSSKRFSNLLIDLCQNQLGLPEIVKLNKDRYGTKIKGLKLRDDEKDEDIFSPICKWKMNNRDDM